MIAPERWVAAHSIGCVLAHDTYTWPFASNSHCLAYLLILTTGVVSGPGVVVISPNRFLFVVAVLVSG